MIILDWMLDADPVTLALIYLAPFAAMLVYGIWLHVREW